MKSTGGVILDSWKLPYFVNHLTEKGYSFTKKEGPLPGVVTLMVSFDDAEELRKVVEEAQKICWRVKNSDC